MTARARPETGSPRPWRPPLPADVRLRNGVRVVTRRRGGSALAAGVLVLDARPDHEPAGFDGVALLAGLLLAERSTRLDADSFAEALERLGATVAAGVDRDGAALSFRCPVSRLATVLGLIAESVVQPGVVQADVDRLAGLQIAAIQAAKHNPAGLAADGFRSVAFAAGSRYARAVEGDPGSVAAIGTPAVAAFLDANAGPRRTTVVLVADLPEDDLVALAAGAFDEWSAPAQPAPAAPAPEPGHGPRLLLVDRPGSVQSAVVIGGLGPAADDPGRAALEVGLHALGGALTSRLDAVLREEKGYTYGFRTAAEAFRSGGVCVGRGSFDTAVTAPAVGDALAEIARAASGGITPDECGRAVAYLAGSMPVRLQTAGAEAFEIADNLGAGLPPDQTARRLEALRAVTAAAASEALARWFEPDRLHVVVAGDAASVAGPLAGIGLGEPVVQR